MLVSDNFPLHSNCRSKSSTSIKLKIENKFNDIRNGYNMNFPEYLIISNLNPNPKTKRYRYIKDNFNNINSNESLLNDKNYFVKQIKAVDNAKKDFNFLNKNNQYNNIIPSYSDICFKEKKNKLNKYKKYTFNNVVNNYNVTKHNDLNSKLKHYIPKINYKISNTLDNKEKDLNNTHKSKLPILYQTNDIVNNSSSYLKNSNDYCISEGDYITNSSNNIYSLPKKDIISFDCINYRYNKVKPDKIVANNISNYNKR